MFAYLLARLFGLPLQVRHSPTVSIALKIDLNARCKFTLPLRQLFNKGQGLQVFAFLFPVVGRLLLGLDLLSELLNAQLFALQSAFQVWLVLVALFPQNRSRLVLPWQFEAEL